MGTCSSNQSASLTGGLEPVLVVTTDLGRWAELTVIHQHVQGNFLLPKRLDKLPDGLHGRQVAV